MILRTEPIQKNLKHKRVSLINEHINKSYFKKYIDA